MPEIKTMYLAVAYGGKWDDEWEMVRVGSFDKELIEQYIAKKEAEIAENNRAGSILREYDNQYRLNAPQPEYLEMQDVPKWPSGLGMHEITQAMRDERSQAIGRNEMIAARNSVRYHDWDEKRRIARREYFKFINTTIEYDEYMREINEAYRIDEIEVI